ncbi:MAG: hypothetical protein V1646_02940 [bacterium]
MKFKKIFLYLFVSGSFLNLMSSSPALRSYSDDLFTHLDDKSLIAQEEFEEFYRDLLAKDFFSEDEKRLILKGSIDKNIIQSGPVLLNLIEWGQKNKQDDPMAQLLLQKLGRYFYFAFRDFVNEIDIEKKDKGRFYCLLHKFYKFKISNETRSDDVFQQSIYPFRATLSKAMIFLLIVNSTELSYKEKIKHSVYYLDKIKRELFEVKKTLADCSLKDEEIDEFIEFLQVYSVAEPLLKPSFLKTFLKIMSVVLVVFIVVCVVIWFVAQNSGTTVKDWSIGLLNDFLKGLEEKEKESPVIGCVFRAGNQILKYIDSQPRPAEPVSQQGFWGRIGSGFSSFGQWASSFWNRGNAPAPQPK